MSDDEFEDLIETGEWENGSLVIKKEVKDGICERLEDGRWNYVKGELKTGVPQPTLRQWMKSWRRAEGAAAADAALNAGAAEGMAEHGISGSAVKTVEMEVTAALAAAPASTPPAKLATIARAEVKKGLSALVNRPPRPFYAKATADKAAEDLLQREADDLEETRDMLMEQIRTCKDPKVLPGLVKALTQCQDGIRRVALVPLEFAASMEGERIKGRGDEPAPARHTPEENVPHPTSPTMPAGGGTMIFNSISTGKPISLADLASMMSGGSPVPVTQKAPPTLPAEAVSVEPVSVIPVTPQRVAAPAPGPVVDRSQQPDWQASL